MGQHGSPYYFHPWLQAFWALATTLDWAGAYFPTMRLPLRQHSLQLWFSPSFDAITWRVLRQFFPQLPYADNARFFA